MLQFESYLATYVYDFRGLGLNVSVSSCSWMMSAASAVMFKCDIDKLMFVILCSLFSTLKVGFLYWSIYKFYALLGSNSTPGKLGVLFVGLLLTESIRLLLLVSSKMPDRILDLFSLPILSLPFLLLSLLANGFGSIFKSLSFYSWSRPLSLYGPVFTLKEWFCFAVLCCLGISALLS